MCESVTLHVICTVPSLYDNVASAFVANDPFAANDIHIDSAYIVATVVPTCIVMKQ